MVVGRPSRVRTWRRGFITGILGGAQRLTHVAFFDGLIPEGWLLEIAERTWKLDPRDRMGLLLSCCRDCIGAVGVVPLEEEEQRHG